MNDPLQPCEDAAGTGAANTHTNTNANASNASVRGGGGAANEAAGGGAATAARSSRGASAGAPQEPLPGDVQFNPSDLLKVLDALSAPPGAAAAVSASGASFELPGGASATELMAVLDLLGAPPNPNPMLEQMVLDGAREEEVAALLVCQPVKEAGTATPSRPAAPSKPATPAKAAAKLRAGDRQDDSIDWDAPD